MRRKIGLHNHWEWLNYPFPHDWKTWKWIKTKEIFHLRVTNSKAMEKCFIDRIVIKNGKNILWQQQEEKEDYRRSIVAIDININTKVGYTCFEDHALYLQKKRLLCTISCCNLDNRYWLQLICFSRVLRKKRPSKVILPYDLFPELTKLGSKPMGKPEAGRSL